MGEQSAAQTQEWAVGDPSQYQTAGLPSAAAQGSNCAGTKFTGPYDANAEDLLFTPEIDFTGKTSGTLSFQASFDLATNGSQALDGVRLLATPDGGTTWYLVSANPSYNFQSCAAFAGSSGTSTPAFSGSQSTWTSYSVDVTPALAVGPKWTFAWEFASGAASGSHAGYFLDNIQVTGQ
jgi:hypothetical protein